ncbi:hypothetical protein QTI66_32215 [Variovorax sp. J22R133]|uniref:hypothetical protein n=1 Tax=Variovorax brevis TaxID=3053503 RepID=UPI002576F819|nr:hypothetical protein [Variovorax sp. J22R133]MDM0116802.1 hypothetical protein [Variovorax sp. J22R133]
MMGSLLARPEFPELELSAQPAERKVQVRVLENVLAVVERMHLQGRIMRWSDLVRFAETSAVAEATSAHTDSLPAAQDFGSFEELKARRDATGVVRLR